MTASVARLHDALPEPPPAEVARAKADALLRPIAYPFGSGQADEIALRAGLRPLIRELLTTAELERRRPGLSRAGFLCEVAPLAYGLTREGWDAARARDVPEDASWARRAVFIGKDPARIAEAIACDLAKTDEADVNLGRLLGYPRCCVEGFVESSSQRRNPEVHRASLARTTGRCAARLNVLDLAVFHWLSWYPCRFDCPLALAYADAVAGLVARAQPAFAERIDAALARPRLLLLDEVQLSLEGAWDGTTLTVREAWPTARDRHPQAALDEGELAAVARATALVRTAKTVAVDGSALVLDGQPVPLPQPPLLVPFG